MNGELGQGREYEDSLRPHFLSFSEFTWSLVVDMFWNAATRWVALKLNSLTTQVPPPPRSEDDKTPRKILLVQAHPLEDSFSAAIANAVVEGAKDGGHELRRRSLYQEKYQ